MTTHSVGQLVSALFGCLAIAAIVTCVYAQVSGVDGAWLGAIPAVMILGLCAAQLVLSRNAK